MSLLRECRAISTEVGGFDVAWTLPTEVRNWWVSEMIREREGREVGDSSTTSPDGRRIVRTDVPRGSRG